MKLWHARIPIQDGMLDRSIMHRSCIAFAKQANEQEEVSRDKIRNVLSELKLSERHITEASQANGSDVAATETSQCIDYNVRQASPTWTQQCV